MADLGRPCNPLVTILTTDICIKYHWQALIIFANTHSHVVRFVHHLDCADAHAPVTFHVDIICPSLIRSRLSPAPTVVLSIPHLNPA
jgi:hypothetical protein